MFRLTRSQVQPIGLDIGQDSVKMLQLETLGSRLAVYAAARQMLVRDAAADPQLRIASAVEVIRKMLRGNGFYGRKVVIAVPREMLHVKNLRLPPMPASELQSAVEFEARGIFPFDTEDATIQYLPVGEVRQGGEVRQELVVVATRNEDIANLLEQLHLAGVEVASIDLEASALYRTAERFIRRREDEQEVHVLVDIGTRRSGVVIGRGRDINFVKSIDIGGTQLLEAISEKLGISTEEARALRGRLAEPVEPAPSASLDRDTIRQAVASAMRPVVDELAREISLCLRYYSVTFRGHRPTKVKLVGGEGGDPQLQAMLNSVLAIPVECGRPLYSVDTARMKPHDRRGAMSEWALAFGLGLKFTKGGFGARDGKPRDINAPRPDLTPGRAEIVDLASIVDSATREDAAGGTISEFRGAPRDVNREAAHA
jgi:type IV pilus assembly protein PilM